MALESTFSAGLGGDALRVFFALQIDLPAYTLRLIEGDGTVAFTVDGETATFTGRDDIYGSLSGLGSITESIATSAPVIDISLLPPTEGALGDLDQPEVQGSLTRIWFGILDEATGLPIGSPELFWIGEFDTGVVSESADTRVIDCTIASAWERMFAAQEGVRLNNVWHQAIHPGDDCLSWNTQVTRSQPWGMNSPSPQPGSQPSTGGGGGGSSSGGSGSPFDGRDAQDFAGPGGIIAGLIRGLST